MTYVQRVLKDLIERNPGEKEFHQAATEILSTLEPMIEAHPEYEAASLLERFTEPERTILFRVPWVDDNGKVHINKGYRVQFNSAIGPFKGGLRFVKLRFAQERKRRKKLIPYLFGIDTHFGSAAKGTRLIRVLKGGAAVITYVLIHGGVLS